MRRPVPLAAAAAALAAAVLYAGTLGHGFAWDDALNIERNPLVTEHRWGAIAGSPYHAGPSAVVPTGAWRPLATASYAVNHALLGPKPWSFHAVNVALHAAVCALVVLVAAAAGATLFAALAAGLLFAAHPIHAEAVANVSGRPELLAALFVLLALLAYDAARRRPAWIAASAVFLALALLSKETAAVFPAIALAWDALRPGRGGIRETAIRAAVPVAVVALYLVSRTAVLGGLTAGATNVTAAENLLATLPLGERLATALAVLARGALLLLWPARLTPDYGPAEIVPASSIAAPEALAGLAAILLATCFVVWSWRRAPSAAFWTIFLASAWSIVSNLVVLIGTVFGERLLYLPSVAACALAGLALAPVRRRWSTGLLVALVAAAGIRTVAAGAAWKDDYTLFSSAVASGAASAKVIGSLGGELAMRGDLDRAEARLREALTIAPALAPVRINLALVLLRRGDRAGAIAELKRAAADDPQHDLPRRLLEGIEAAPVPSSPAALPPRGAERPLAP